MAWKVLLPPQVFELNKMASRYEVANAYGLFRRMTGVDGRDEVELTWFK